MTAPSERMHNIALAVANFYDVTVGQMRSSDKHRSITLARHVAIYLIHSHLHLTRERIGAYFVKDQSTVTHALKLMQKMEGDTREQIEFLNVEIHKTEAI